MLEQYANVRNHIFEIFHDTKKRAHVMLITRLSV